MVALVGQTAEDLLGALRLQMSQKVALAEALYRPLYPNLPEKQQVLLMGPLDEAREFERCIFALDIALAELARRPEPQGDAALPGNTLPRRPKAGKPRAPASPRSGGTRRSPGEAR